MKNEPSTLHLLSKSFKLAVNNIWRNKVLSLATIFVIGTIIFIFNIILSINFIAQDALQDLSQKVDINIYLKEDTTFEQAQYLISEIERIEQVEKVQYISKDSALQRLKTTQPHMILAFEKYNLGNPLPASINITTRHPRYHKAIGEFLTQDKYQIYLSNIVKSGDVESTDIISSVSQNLIDLTSFTRQLIFWLILAFLIGGALIILNAIQITIFARKKEIGIMKLVGASNHFIRAPFVIESAIYATLAVFLGFFMVIILMNNLGIKTDINFAIIFTVELIITMGLSLVSSLIATHEYMRKDIFAY